MTEDRYWEHTPLDAMSRGQWESLCDGCGRCCLHKLQDEYGGGVYYTAVACRLLDPHECSCTQYTDRKQLVPDCMVLTPEHLGSLSWLPDTCAYRLLDEGKPLPDWHPLVTGDPDSVHAAGISVRGRTLREENVHEDDYEECIIKWVNPTYYPHPISSSEDDGPG